MLRLLFFSQALKIHLPNNFYNMGLVGKDIFCVTLALKILTYV